MRMKRNTISVWACVALAMLLACMVAVGCKDNKARVNNTKNVTFSKCNIYENGAGVYVDEDCESVSFEKSKFHDNSSYTFSCASKVVLRKCKLESRQDGISDNVKMVNCEVEYSDDEDME